MSWLEGHTSVPLSSEHGAAAVGGRRSRARARDKPGLRGVAGLSAFEPSAVLLEEAPAPGEAKGTG